MSMKKKPTILVSSDEENSQHGVLTKKHLYPTIKMKEETYDSSNEGELQVVEDSEPLSPPPSSTGEVSIRTTFTIKSDSVQNSSQVKNLPMWSDFPGECNFSFYFTNPQLDSSGSVKNSWEYLPSVNQVFIKPDKVLLVHFDFDRTKISSKTELFIRAVPVYFSTEYMHIPVDRCKMHWYEIDPTNKAHENDEICMCGAHDLVGHIVRCVSRKAVYCYNSMTKRHSVLFPITDTTSDVLYTFHCKSSCPSGMQRRPIKLVFTLENSTGEIYGRCSVSVKICSCPRRDKERMEKDRNLKSSALSSGTLTGSPEQNGEGGVDIVDLKTGINLTEQLKGVLEMKRFVPNGETKEGVVKKLKTELTTVKMLAESIEKRCSQMEEMINWL